MKVDAMSDGRTIDIAPSILAADFSRLGEQIAAVERGGATILHVDVMDGHFVPNITVGLPVVKSLVRATRLPIDAHLMISEPGRYAEQFVKAGAPEEIMYVSKPHIGTFRLVKMVELMRATIEELGGEIGDVTEVHAWTDRPIWPQGIKRPTDAPPVRTEKPCVTPSADNSFEVMKSRTATS